jgi:N utilization substance protein A
VTSYLASHIFLILKPNNMSELFNTIKQICDEKGLSLEAVVGTIESALAAAYRKDFGEKNQNIKVEFDIETGKSKVYDVKTVVEDMPPEEEDLEGGEGEEDGESKNGKDGGKNKKTRKSSSAKASDDKRENKDDKDVKDNGKKDEVEEEEEKERKFNPRTEIQLSDAKLIKKAAKVGDEIRTKLEVPGEFGRMAAQTAKQVIIQRLREAERDMIFNEFKEKEHEVISGVVQRREGRVVLVDLGKAVGILPSEEQIYNEQYKPGARIKVYVKEVAMGSKGPEVILSRTSEEILKKVFYLEIPEISNGLVELKSVAREAGSRAKVAVAAASDNIDPIGSCVGQRGARIQTIINELGGEKVDIIEYDEDPEKFIANALSPAKILSIEIDEKKKEAVVKVSSDQLSLAIGKGGQNVRLAARLTGWKIDIAEQKAEEGKGDGEGRDGKKEKEGKEDKTENKKTEKPSSAKATEDKQESKDEKEGENKDKGSDKKDVDSKTSEEKKEESKDREKKDKKVEKDGGENKKSKKKDKENKDGEKSEK